MDRIEEQSLLEEQQNAARIDPNDPLATLSEEQLDVYTSALDGYVCYRRCRNGKELCSSTNCL